MENSLIRARGWRSDTRRKLPTLALATALVIGLVFPITIMSEPAQASPDPDWLSGWGYRKDQTITGSTAGAQTDYQMKMTVHKGSGTDNTTDVFCGGNCRDDFWDIRWTKDDGTTMMDYWIETLVSGEYAEFWIEIPSVPASPSTVDVYVYYGNATAGSAENGRATFVVWDDYSPSDEQWTEVDPNNRFLIDRDGDERLEITGLQCNETAYICMEKDYSGDFEFRFTLNFSFTTNNAGFVVAGLADSADHARAWDNSLASETLSQNSTTANLRVIRYTNGGQALAEGAYVSYDTTYYSSLRRTGDTLQLFVYTDKARTNIVSGFPTQVTSLTTSPTSYIYTVASVNTGNTFTISGWLDDHYLRNYASPEPAWGSWGEEETGVEIPTVTTQAATNIEATTATGNGDITDTGGEACDERGVEWGTSTGNYPNSHTDTDGFGTGAFTKGMTGLPSGTTIYYRAKAHNSAGWGYGGEQTFLTQPAAPTNVQATDGTHTDKVVITWTKSTGATGYQVYRNGTPLGWLGDVATYNDTGANAPTITGGTASASDETYTTHVALSISGESANNGTTHTYKVRAKNATGESTDSGTNTGYRGVGSLTYQWQRSAADSDADYSDIDGATTASYNYTGAPADGSGRYYKCRLNATGTTQQFSTSDRGYRAVNTPPNEWISPSVVLLVLVLGMIGDFAYLYFKVAKVKDLISGGEAIAGVLIFLIAMIIMWGIAYGLVTA